MSQTCHINLGYVGFVLGPNFKFIDELQLTRAEFSSYTNYILL